MRGKGQLNSSSNLEKSRYNAKVSSVIVLDDGSIKSDETEIMHHIHLYYSELYKRDENVHFNIVNKRGISITKAQYDICSQPFTEAELLSAIDAMKDGKTPGIDGLTAEFYKKVQTPA